MAPLLGLLVDHSDQRVADEVVAELALDDARAETLVHQLAAGLLSTLQIPHRRQEEDTLEGWGLVW